MGHPNPRNCHFRHQRGKNGLRLALNDIRQRAGSRSQCHIENNSVVLGDAHAVDQPKFNDVNAKFRIDNVFECFEDIFALQRTVFNDVCAVNPSNVLRVFLKKM